MGTIMRNGRPYGVGATTDVIADAYDSTVQYIVGDYCMHDNIFYKCKANTTGTWDSTKWDNINVSEELNDAATASGTSYDNTTSRLTADDVQSAIDEVSAEKVSKSGDTMSGILDINANSGTQARFAKSHASTTSESSAIYVGNNIADGTAGSSYGQVVIYGKGTKFATIQATNITSASNQAFELPDASGTIALKEVNNQFSEDQTIDTANGTASTIGTSVLKVGNATASGTAGNSKGQVEIYGEGTKFARLMASSVTAVRNFEFPDKSGTIALKDVNNQFSVNQTVDGKDGTTTTPGFSNLFLGNDTPVGTNGNSRGQLVLYGPNGYYGAIRADGVTGSNKSVSLPNNTGTIALTSDISDYPRFKNWGTFTSSSQVATFLTEHGVSSNKFTDLRVGDYVTIAGYTCYIAGFNTQHNQAKSFTSPHITFIVDLGASQMNTTATTAGGYEGATTLQTFLSSKETQFTNILGTYLKTRQCYTSTSVDSSGRSNAGAWHNHKFTLLSEINIFGCAMDSQTIFDQGECELKLPIFNVISAARLFNTFHIWLRTVHEATSFAVYSNNAMIGAIDANTANLHVVALFCIG